MTPISEAPRESFPAAGDASSAGSSSPSPRTPPWRKPWLYFVAIFCGFMFAAAGTAAVPASAQWTSGIVCASGYHLTHQSSDTSYGNTSQTSVGFRCVNGAGSSTSVGTLPIFGLQFVLGTLVAFAILVAVGSALRLRTTPMRA